MTTTLIPTGYNALEETRTQLQPMLADKHACTRYVLIGVPHHVLPEDQKVPEGTPVEEIKWVEGNPLDLQFPEGAKFACVRVIATADSPKTKPGWAAGLAATRGYKSVIDVGTGKVAMHSGNAGEILDYYKTDADELTEEEVTSFLGKHPDVPAYATGKWRDTADLPEGTEALSHEDEAKYTAMSVQKYIGGSFTMIEMGKRTTQVVTL